MTLFNPAWYGARAQVLTQDAQSVVVDYGCQGRGLLKTYALFDGIQLCFLDFDTEETLPSQRFNSDIIQINHCREGRYECEFPNHTVSFLPEGCFAVAGTAYLPVSLSFPLKRYVGVSLVIDKQALSVATRSMMQAIPINLDNIGTTLGIAQRWYVSETPPKLAHLFSELYEAEGEAALMQHVSLVFQDVFLFKQSIFENIRMGRPDAREEEVIRAAKAAQCHDFIMKLPQGYQTIVGKGVHLSGGERQRISIARAIIKDAPIIVLDEATAFSDPENEYLIQKAFEQLMAGPSRASSAQCLSPLPDTGSLSNALPEGDISISRRKTVIMIAHRLATIRHADKILVMEQGRLVEQGTHDALVAAGGRYAQMWAHYTEATHWRIGRKAVSQ